MTKEITGTVREQQEVVAAVVARLEKIEANHFRPDDLLQQANECDEELRALFRTHRQGFTREIVARIQLLLREIFRRSRPLLKEDYGIVEWDADRWW